MYPFKCFVVHLFVVCLCECHSTCVEGRGLLPGVGSLLLPCGTQRSTSGCPVWCQMLWPFEPIILRKCKTLKFLAFKLIVIFGVCHSKVMSWYQCVSSGLCFFVVFYASVGMSVSSCFYLSHFPTPFVGFISHGEIFHLAWCSCAPCRREANVYDNALSAHHPGCSLH